MSEDDVVVSRVHLTGLLVCRDDGQVALVDEYLERHVALTRAEAGCISFEVTRNENPLVWRDRPPLHAPVQSIRKPSDPSSAAPSGSV